jgi:hypothetical protein
VLHPEEFESVRTTVSGKTISGFRRKELEIYRAKNGYKARTRTWALPSGAIIEARSTTSPEGKHDWERVSIGKGVRSVTITGSRQGKSAHVK